MKKEEGKRKDGGRNKGKRRRREKGDDGKRRGMLEKRGRGRKGKGGNEKLEEKRAERRNERLQATRRMTYNASKGMKNDGTRRDAGRHTVQSHH